MYLLSNNRFEQTVLYKHYTCLKVSVFEISHLMMTKPGTAVYSKQSNICARRPVSTPQTTTSCPSYKLQATWWWRQGSRTFRPNIIYVLEKTDKLDQGHQVVTFKTLTFVFQYTNEQLIKTKLTGPINTDRELKRLFTRCPNKLALLAIEHVSNQNTQLQNKDHSWLIMALR